MNKDEESYFDAVFLSPHKFLGGPGTSGLLIFNENIYPKIKKCTSCGKRYFVYKKDIGTTKAYECKKCNSLN